MRRPNVHIVLRNGVIEEAYAECDVDVDIIVYDLDCPEGDMKEELERRVAELPKVFKEVEIY
jgi:hypothetical protein